jgi:hypothetical protein
VVEEPRIQILSNNNKSVVLDIDWAKSVILNDELKSYELLINDRSFYIGKSTNLIHMYNFSNCIQYENDLNDFDDNKNGYIELKIELRVKTSQFFLNNNNATKYKLIVNCTVDDESDFSNIMNYNTEIRPWLIVILFIIGLLVLLCK